VAPGEEQSDGESKRRVVKKQEKQKTFLSKEKKKDWKKHQKIGGGNSCVGVHVEKELHKTPGKEEGPEEGELCRRSGYIR